MDCIPTLPFNPFSFLMTVLSDSALPAPGIDWTTWVPGMRATLLFIFEGDRVLLIRKKRGMGAGKINGPGGKMEPGETPEQCAIRETQEELGVTGLEVSEAGLLRFQFTGGPGLLCHVFRAEGLEGEPVETDEAVPLWTAVGDVPFDEMWADDRLWFHHLVAGTPFVGSFEFDGDTMLSAAVELGARP